MNKLKSTITGIITVMTISVLGFFWSFFSQRFPDALAQIDVLKGKIFYLEKEQVELKASIKDDLKDIKETQKVILDVLLKENHNH